MIASVNKPRAHNKPFTLTPAKHEPTVTISPNPLCKPNTSSHQLQLINLNKQTKATNCSPLKTINLMSPKPAKCNLLTTVDKLDAFSAADEDTFLSKLCEPEPAPSSMLDDSLTSLQWLQSLNIMKNASLPATTCSLSPHSHTSDKAQPSLDCDLDSATVPAAKSGDKHALNPSYPPLSPPLSVHCSASPQSTCSSNTSTKRRSKKAHSKTMQHQVSAPAILQPSKSQSIMANSASTSATLFRNSFLKDRHEYRTNADVKPPYSYSQLIILSMKESKQSKMTLQMIYDWIIGNFSYFKKAEPNWQVTFKNSIRHNLSLNKCFRKIARQKDEPGKGGFWTLDPEFERQLDESNSLGSPPVNAKCYKRKRKSGDGDEAKKRPRPDPVQYSEMENCDFVRSDANLSQVNKPPQAYAYMESGPAYMGHVNEPVAACNHFDFGESFAGSFSSHGMGYMKNFEDESGLFGFEANLPTLELDQFTDSSCTSSSSPDDLVGGLLKKSSSLAVAHDTELSELFDITSQFGLDEGFSATSLINSGGEKRPVDLTVQGTGIRQPKWWPDSLLDLDTGLMGVQAQDDECDSGTCALDFGLNVDDLDFLSVESAVTTQQQQQQQQQQQARKRIYTHQSKLNPATHKTCKTKPAF